jgi:hypothetical protein
LADLRASLLTQKEFVDAKRHPSFFSRKELADALVLHFGEVN